MRPVPQRVEAATDTLLAAAATVRRRHLCLFEVVAAARGATLAAPRVVHADHARLERAEEGLEVGDAREHDAEALDGEGAHYGRPGIESPVRRLTRPVDEDDLGDDGGGNEDAEGEDYYYNGLFALWDLHAPHDDSRNYDEKYLGDDVEDSEGNPERGLLLVVSQRILAVFGEMEF